MALNNTLNVTFYTVPASSSTIPLDSVLIILGWCVVAYLIIALEFFIYDCLTIVILPGLDLRVVFVHRVVLSLLQPAFHMMLALQRILCYLLGLRFIFNVEITIVGNTVDYNMIHERILDLVE